MPNVNLPQDLGIAQVVGASQADLPISKTFRITGRGSQVFRADIYAGKVEIDDAVTATLQDTSGLGIWDDKKTASITTSSASDLSCTFANATDIFTSASHGLSSGTPVAVTAATLPQGVVDTEIYYAQVIDVNTFKISQDILGNDVVDGTTDGATVVVTPISVFSIKLLPQVAGDQAHLPLRGQGRIVVDSGVSDSAQVLAVIITQDQ